MDETFQICDRCKIPTERAVIECNECAMMIFSSTGDEMQAMRTCIPCDQLIHDISYKKSHKRHHLFDNEPKLLNPPQVPLPHRVISL